LPVLVGVTFFWQSKMSMPAQNQRQPGQNQDKKQEMMQDFQAALSKQTLYVFPVMFTFIALKLPSALSLYWVISTAFGIIQQYLIMKEKKSINNQSNLSPLALEKGKSGKTQIAVKKRE
jgi:YidC/Oxa1 family membrane protein insertase